MTGSKNPGQEGELRWDAVILEGFGLFNRPARLDLAPGANVLVAANESGKSTLAASVPAILFGLTGGTVPIGFSEARFRAWHRHDAYRGALLFTRGDRRYLIERDFAARKVRLLTAEGASWRVLLDESHHAGAHRRGHSYQSAVVDLIGMSDRELMEQTFYLTQPLPGAKELATAVQVLLSGGGGALEGALKALHEQLREVTRYTAVLGVTSRDARDERRLEEVRAQRTRLETEMAEQKQRVDSLEGLQSSLSGARAAEEAARAQLLAARRLEEAWGRWRSLRAAYEAALTAQRSLATAVAEARTTTVNLKEAQGMLGEYPEYPELPPETERLLAQLAGLEADAGELARRRAQAREEIAALQERLAGAKDELSEYPPVLATQPDLLSVYDRLLTATETKEDLARRRAQLAQARCEAAAELAQAKDWRELSDTPVAEVRRLRREAPSLCRNWANWQEAALELSLAEDQWAAAFGSLEFPEPPELERLLDALGRLGVLEGEQARWRALRREFADEASLPQPEEVLEGLRRLLAFPSRRLPGGREGVGAWRLAAGAAFMFSGGVLGWLAWFLTGRPLLAAGAVALALVGTGVGGLVWTALARLEQRRQDRFAAEIAAELGLPADWLAREAHELGNAEARLAEFVARRRALDPERLEQEISELTTRLPGQLASLADRAAALALLRDLASRRREAQRNQTFLAGQLDVDVRGQPTAGPWEALARLAALAGCPATAPDGLVAWLGELSDESWLELEAAAAAWEDLRRRVSELDGRQAELIRAEESRESGSEAWCLAEISRLRKLIAPFDETTSRNLLRARLAAWQETTRQAGLVAHALELAERALSDVVSRQKTAAAQVDQLREGSLRRLLAAVGGDLDAARERWAKARSAAGEVGRFADRLATILKTHGAESVEQLELRQIDQQNRALVASRDWDNLLEGFPGLPPRDAVEDVERLDRAGVAIRTGREQAEAALEAAMDARTAAARELARIEGAGPPLNLVQAAQMVQQLRLQEAQLAAEAEALALAHRELAAAGQEYQAAYRGELSASASAHFAALAGGQEREVRLDEGFVVSVQLPPAADRGTSTVRPESLSQGAQDQLFVALRLAIADLLAGRVTLPLLFDDPFLTFDLARLAAMRATWDALADRRQVWLLTHRPEFANWGQAAAVRRLDRWPDWEAEIDGA